MAEGSNRRLRFWGSVAVGLGLPLATTPSFAACLAKLFTVNDVTLHTFMLAPASEVAEYVSLGFHQIPCPTDLSDLREYVNRICSGSPIGKVPGINTDVAIGKPRDYACASAQAGLSEAGG